MKKTNVNIFGIAAIALALGTMSFKASQPLAEVTRWHEISTQGSSPETDIVGPQTPDPTEGGDCNSISQNTRCAVQLTYEESYNPTGETVEDVEDDSGNPASGRTFKTQ